MNGLAEPEQQTFSTGENNQSVLSEFTPEDAERQFTFLLIHGSWHQGEHWKFVEQKLQAAGHQTVTVDLPIENPDATLDDYADIAAKAVENYDNIVIAGHSMGGDVIDRVAMRLPAIFKIYIASRLRPETIDYSDRRLAMLIRKNSNSFLNVSTMLANQAQPALIGKNAALELLYPDCASEDADWAVDLLRPQHRGVTGSRLTKLAEIPGAYILARRDKVVRPAWSRYLARNLLNIEPVEIESGHVPLVSCPRELGRIMLAKTAELVAA